MIGFGEKLRREREMRGVSLEEISESTKIGTRSLRALEEDDFEKLPGGVFNRGFVRAYSRFLGLDEDQTVADFDAAQKEYNLAHGQVEQATLEPEPEPESPNGLRWLAAAMFVLVLVAWAGYFLRRSAAEKVTQSLPNSAQQSQPSPSPIAPAIPAAADSSSPASTTPVAPAIHESQEAKGVEPSPQKSKSSDASEAASPAEAGADKTTAAQTHPNASSPIRLEVFAREESWLSVSADGKDLGQQLLAAQKSRTIHAQKEVKLKLGNAGGVEISFNGKPVNIDGEPKQVKEFTFTPEGLRQ